MSHPMGWFRRFGVRRPSAICPACRFGFANDAREGSRAGVSTPTFFLGGFYFRLLGFLTQLFLWVRVMFKGEI